MTVTGTWHDIACIPFSKARNEWACSHFSLPVMTTLSENNLEAFVSVRDKERRSSIVSLRANLNDGGVQFERIAAPGEIGLFDDSGCSMGCYLKTDSCIRVYYVGWNLGATVPWRNSIGVLESYDSGITFHRRKAPIIDRCELDNYSLSYPFVIQEEECYTMWYGTNLSWGQTATDMRHGIRRATSKDGIHWKKDETLCLAPGYEQDEFAVARPSVLKDKEGYHMWFASRGRRYQINYAYSTDGRAWERAKKPLFNVNHTQEERTYPHVFVYRKEIYMAYNKSNYGRDGFSLAVLR